MEKKNLLLIWACFCAALCAVDLNKNFALEKQIKGRF